MKKTLLIVSALMMAGSVYAETGLYMGDVKMEPGKTYTCNEIEGDEYDGYMINPHLTVKGNAGTAFNFSFTSSHSVLYCGSGECIPSTEATYNGNIDASGVWDPQLEYVNYMAESIDELDKDVTVDITLDSKNYKLVMNSTEGKVSTIGKDRQVVYSNNMLVYNLSDSAEAIVYDMQGRSVMNVAVNGSGSLDLGKLTRGAYIYRIGANCGKVWVK